MLHGSNEINRLANDLTAAPLKAQRRATTALGKAVKDIEATAKTLAPVDTGFLRSSISSDVSVQGTTIRGEVGPTANYGAYVEGGTRRQRAQPYLRPATDMIVPRYEDAVAQITEDLL